MSKYLHILAAWAARAHDYILSLNDSFEYSFSDKQLHFIVIGAVGLLLLLAVYPLFKYLANRGKVLAIAWVYALTVLLGLTFAIEIGQGVTGSGAMDIRDVAAGLGGFFAVTAAILVLRLIIWAGKGAARLARRGARAE